MRNNPSRWEETRSEAFEQKSVQRNWRVYRYSGHADDDDLFCRIHDVGPGTA